MRLEVEQRSTDGCGRMGGGVERLGDNLVGEQGDPAEVVCAAFGGEPVSEILISLDASLWGEHGGQMGVFSRFGLEFVTYVMSHIAF